MILTPPLLHSNPSLEKIWYSISTHFTVFVPVLHLFQFQSQRHCFPEIMTRQQDLENLARQDEVDELSIMEICDQILNLRTELPLIISGTLIYGVVKVFSRKVKRISAKVALALNEINRAGNGETTEDIIITRNLVRSRLHCIARKMHFWKSIM
ncbi:Sister chromatid cohesion 1 protein 1 [Spatholobus suberectus]|nr:Sister chromatid cohesion 1 protein 1 [Spatholobus suberectus]